MTFKDLLVGLACACGTGLVLGLAIVAWWL
jgi:hypothetical protein